MQNLPLEVINNILIIKHDSEVKELKKQISELNHKLEDIKIHNANMLNFIEVNEVKYCECCDIYGNDDEIIYYEDFCEYLCEHCNEFREEQKNIS
jgi:hypothetical protein